MKMCKNLEMISDKKKRVTKRTYIRTQGPLRRRLGHARQLGLVLRSARGINRNTATKPLIGRFGARASK